MSKRTERVVKTTSWSAGPGCHGGCGVKLTVKDNRVIKVEGDEDHPWSQGRTCPRCLALTQYMYHPDRLKYPLKRMGARGEGKWERISWDEAYDTIEKRLKEIRSLYGAESVIFVQGTGRDIGGPITMLMYSYGSPNWVQLGLSGHSCYTPRQAAMYVTHGDYTVMDCSQFLEKRYDDPEYVVPKCTIVWGQNPPPTCPDGFYGHWVVDVLKRGSQLIVIDPRVTWLASRAKIHLQIRPSTDGALALGMANYIISEGLYDKEFVNKWVYGFAEFTKRCSEYDLDTVSRITWVPKDKIIEAARLYATSKPAAIQWGIPIDANPEGMVVSQAITSLWCLTGNVDNPGGNVFAKSSFGVTSYPFTQDEMKALYGEELVKNLSEKRIGTWKYPMIKNFRAWASEDVCLDMLETGQPYQIHGAWIQTNNILSSAQDSRRHYEALKNLDFIVAVDTFQNPTTQALADIILPAATFAEKDSIRTWWAPLCAMPQAVQVAECKSDWEINFELAKRLSLSPFKYKTVKEMFNDRFTQAGFTFEGVVKDGGWKWAPKGHPSLPYYRYQKGLLRSDGQPGFNTPTGKIELYATRLKEWGLNPLPYYQEPEEGPISTPELWKEYPVIINSGRRSSVFFHSEHRMIPWLREIDPNPTVEIHPDTAREAGVKDGDWVYIENRRGRVKFKAKVTPTILPHVVAPAHNWWLPETEGKAPDLYSVFKVNINTIIPAQTQGKCGWGGSAIKRTIGRIVKAED
jgi:anaerobic selenocysteine-containing dehydrogenase